LLGNGLNVNGARTCSIDGSINGTSLFPGGVPEHDSLKGVLTPADIQAISDSLNSNRVTGQQRYITTCAGCHGVDARGGPAGDSVAGAGPRAILRSIHKEDGSMSFLGCLPASDLKAIGNYLTRIRRDDDDDDSRGDRARGGNN
jgi:mono/diheme cytochrome c family protein